MNQTPAKHKAPPCDHATRLIDQHYQVHNNQLHISENPVSQLIETYGSPLFVYDANVVQKTITSVKDILPSNFDLYYSIKANPNASLLNLMSNCPKRIKTGRGLASIKQSSFKRFCLGIFR